jgi:Transposase DDE domain
MFKENAKHRQVTIYGIVHQFSVGTMKRLDKSWAPVFRKLVFEKIDERRYAVLYSTIDSRPNFPVNVWVGLEIIKWFFDYTDEELLDQFHFNLLCARALGQENLGDITLSERTIYYNRQRLLEYESKTGGNLLEEEFQAITDAEIAKLKLNTKIQRMDSSMIGSCLKQMSRLELIAKVLQNFYRALPEAEQSAWKERLSGYIEEEADHIAYQLKRAEVSEHLKKLGSLLLELHRHYENHPVISQLTSYQHLSRVLLEQFDIAVNLEKTEIEVKSAKEISSGSLQNPADDTATYRTKNGEHYQGDILNVSETCHKDNPVQLLTDVSLHPNNTPDDTILTERISQIKARTAVEQMITDGGYSGEKAESECQQESVTLVPTEVKGRKLDKDEISLAQFDIESNQVIRCPVGQSPLNQRYQPEKEHHIVHLATAVCSTCPQREHCPAHPGKRFFSLIFNDRQVLLAKRRQQLGEESYRSLCNLRPAVEGTMSQFKRKTRDGKLRIRLTNRIRNAVILMAIGINFGRLLAYYRENQPGLSNVLASFILLLMCLSQKIHKNLNYVVFPPALVKNPVFC